MKKIATILILSSFCFELIMSQRIDTIYYNNKDKIASKNKFDYYRIARQDTDRVRVFDYYKSGKIRMSGAFRSFNFEEEIGPFYYYSKKDKITQLEVHQPSLYPEIYSKYKNYLDNIPKQPDSLKLIIRFHNNLTVRSIGYVSDCCYYFGPWFFFTKKGEPMYLVTYLSNSRNGTYIMFIDHKPYIKGQYINNEKDGLWTYYDFNEKVRKTVVYNNGKKIK